MSESMRSFEERINELIKKQEQLKEQEKTLRKRYAEDERKKRTKRLIEIGAIVQSVLGRQTTDGDKQRLMDYLKSQEENEKSFSKAMNTPMNNENKWEL